MIKIGICDDDKVFRDGIGKLLEQYFKNKGLDCKQQEYESARAFLKRKEKTDILLLDIEMEGISGIQLKDYLQREEDIKILFVTSHREGMPEAFGKNVYGFLEKPVDIARLEKYLERMLEDMEDDQVLVIKSIHGELAIKPKDIFYFVSEKKYSRMCSRSGEYFCDMGLRQLEEMLDQRLFFRCHKSYLVNLENISKVGDDICLENGEKIPVSRRRAKGCKDAYRTYIIRRAR